MTAFSNRLPRMAVFGAMAVAVSLVSAHASAGSLDDSLDLEDVRELLRTNSEVRGNPYDFDFDEHWNEKYGFGIVDGARIAYTPETIYYVALGAETNGWSTQLSMKYNDDVYNKGVNTSAKTESATIFDFNGSMNLDNMGMAGSRAFLNIDNVFDKTYISSAHNYGFRPNKPRTVMAGISVDF